MSETTKDKKEERTETDELSIMCPDSEIYDIGGIKYVQRSIVAFALMAIVSELLFALRWLREVDSLFDIHMKSIVPDPSGITKEGVTALLGIVSQVPSTAKSLYAYGLGTERSISEKDISLSDEELNNLMFSMKPSMSTQIIKNLVDQNYDEIKEPIASFFTAFMATIPPKLEDLKDESEETTELAT